MALTHLQELGSLGHRARSFQQPVQHLRSSLLFLVQRQSFHGLIFSQNS